MHGREEKLMEEKTFLKVVDFVIYDDQINVRIHLPSRKGLSADIFWLGFVSAIIGMLKLGSEYTFEETIF